MFWIDPARVRSLSLYAFHALRYTGSAGCVLLTKWNVASGLPASPSPTPTPIRRSGDAAGQCSPSTRARLYMIGHCGAYGARGVLDPANTLVDNRAVSCAKGGGEKKMKGRVLSAIARFSFVVFVEAPKQTVCCQSVMTKGCSFFFGYVFLGPAALECYAASVGGLSRTVYH